MPQGLRRVNTDKPSRNPLAHNNLLYELLTRTFVTGPTPIGFSGDSGCQNPGNLYKSLHARPQPVRPLVPSSARGIDGGPRRFTEVALDEHRARWTTGASHATNRRVDEIDPPEIVARPQHLEEVLAAFRKSSKEDLERKVSGKESALGVMAQDLDSPGSRK